MANYENLPVFKSSYDLLLRLFEISKHWSRDLRYTLGENIKKDLIDTQVLIFKANSTRDKIVYIQKARENITKIKVQLRIVKDLKEVSIKQFASIIEIVESISKQLSAWEKSGQ